ncbi:MAG TPA: ABC transporter ATP-binding protein [Acidimicrobiales bacterium]|jgi:branched-chain amino acid transport system ATP-binding protein|nr:ABC transporter ATP-binding protein [Acidimicrobiales bacterium]
MTDVALAGIAPEPGVAKPDPVLVIDGVRRRYGGVLAVDVDHLEVQQGLITALIGPNGAGKTTLFNVLTGFDHSDEGHWSFGGRGVTGARPHRLAQLGMVRTFQLTKSLNRMTVLENLLLAAPGQRGERFWSSLVPGSWRGQERANAARARELLERFNLGHMADELSGGLSGGQRKLLELARALMVGPQLVMLDEPMAGVNPALTQSLLGHIKALRDDGLTVMFVEHDMDVIMSISDWVVVMAEGAIIAEGRPGDVAGNEDVIAAYLGRHHDESIEQLEAESQPDGRTGRAPEARPDEPSADDDPDAGGRV